MSRLGIVASLIWACLGSGVQAESLDVHALDTLLSSERISFSDGPPKPVNGATFDRMEEVGAIALLTQSVPSQLLLVVNADQLCRVDGAASVLSRVDLQFSEVLIGLLREIDRSGHCKGLMIEGSNQSLHLFLNGVSGGNSEGLWISEKGIVPVRELDRRMLSSATMNSLLAIDPVPDVILAFGSNRLAFERGGSVFVNAWADDGHSVILQVCALDKKLPFLGETAFNRYGAVQDLAYQAASYTNDDDLDPLAYVVCE